MQLAVLGALMWVVALAPLGIYAWLRMEIWVARKLGCLGGWLESVDVILNDEG